MPQSCSIEECERPGFSRGWCQMHYFRWWRHGDPLIKKHRFDGYARVCDVAGCGRVHMARGLCKAHYREQYPEQNRSRPWDDDRRHRQQKRRALKKGATTGEPVLLAEIRARDGNRCGICGKRVGTNPWPHPLSASIDHVVPLTCGGAHDPANVQLAHLRCNVSKGNRGGNEQLRMV